MKIEHAFCELGGRTWGFMPMDIGLALCEPDGQSGACAMEPRSFGSCRLPANLALLVSCSRTVVFTAIGARSRSW